MNADPKMVEKRRAIRRLKMSATMFCKVYSVPITEVLSKRYRHAQRRFISGIPFNEL